MNIREAAVRLEVKPSTVYQLCSAGRLPHVRIGVGRGTIRISESDVEAYLRSARVEAREAGRVSPRRARLPAVPPSGGPGKLRFADALAARISGKFKA